jgi:hypothetical protein
VKQPDIVVGEEYAVQIGYKVTILARVLEKGIEIDRRTRMGGNSRAPRSATKAGVRVELLESHAERWGPTRAAGEVVLVSSRDLVQPAAEELLARERLAKSKAAADALDQRADAAVVALRAEVAGADVRRGGFMAPTVVLTIEAAEALVQQLRSLRDEVRSADWRGK